MSRRPVFFGEMTFDEALDPWRSLSAATRDALIIGGAFTLVIATVFLWAVYVRKPKRRHHSHHRPHRSASDDSSNGSGQSPGRRKWRRPRREHRPRNPTLAETGGLPPARNEAPPDSQF
jgi:hypothetical protein